VLIKERQLPGGDTHLGLFIELGISLIWPLSPQGRGPEHKGRRTKDNDAPTKVKRNNLGSKGNHLQDNLGRQLLGALNIIK